MDENKNPQTQPEAAQDPGKPLSEKRKAALLRYMTILFSAAFVLVLISLILQMHSSEAKISELNAASTSALSNAEALQAENRSLRMQLQQSTMREQELRQRLRRCEEQLDAVLTETRPYREAVRVAPEQVQAFVLGICRRQQEEKRLNRQQRRQRAKGQDR